MAAAAHDFRRYMEIIDKDAIVLLERLKDDLVKGVFQGERMVFVRRFDEVLHRHKPAAPAFVQLGQDGAPAVAVFRPQVQDASHGL